jgi:glutamate:Na+ symporter, ESS family
MEETRKMEKWNIIIYFLLIGLTLFVGKFLKTSLKFLNKLVLPTALLGGFIGLMLSGEVIPGSYEIDVVVMEAIVYHALALGFIALALKDSVHTEKRKLWSTGMVITSTYSLQGFIGILLVMLFFSDKFVGAGLLLPLGFGQGPALAMNFGSMWSQYLGGHGVALGASYAFLGFLWGGIVGVFAINILSRKKGQAKPGHYNEDQSVGKTTIEIDTVREVSVLDGLTVQIVIISVIYALVWLTLYILEGLLSGLGSIGGTIFGLLSGFNFIIGIMYALIYKRILRSFAKKGKNIRFMTNNYMLSNISSTCFNYMIAGGVMTITYAFFSEFGFLLFVISTIGGFATLFYTRFITQKVYTQYKDEYFVGLYGMLTGVASTGIALLKGLDRNLESPVAEELVLGSGTAITMALPLFGLLMLPSIAAGGGGNQALFDLITLVGCFLYTVVMVVILLVRSRRNPK